MTDWVDRLLQWFGKHRRAMPWRDCPEPYAVWISEIMLQQTQVDTVMPYFERFVRLFPDVQALASADEQDVLKAWEGLGYYSRARNLQKAARTIVQDFEGQVPSTLAALRSLPGVGAYTAAAVASIAYDVAEPCVDGNVLRVMARFRAWRDDIAREATKAKTTRFLRKHIPGDCPGDFNQSLMELGAMVCRPRNPDCEGCPLSVDCLAHKRGLTARLPIKSRKGEVPLRLMAAGIVHYRGRYLLGRRGDGGMLAGLWDLPGCELDDDRRIRRRLTSGISAETGITVDVGEQVATVDHVYSHFKVRLSVFNCRRRSGRLAAAVRFAEVRWVPVADLPAYALTGLARKAMGEVSLSESFPG